MKSKLTHTIKKGFICYVHGWICDEKDIKVYLKRALFDFHEVKISRILVNFTQHENLATIFKSEKEIITIIENGKLRPQTDVDVVDVIADCFYIEPIEKVTFHYPTGGLVNYASYHKEMNKDLYT